jgi:hypothetical protein
MALSPPQGRMVKCLVTSALLDNPDNTENNNEQTTTEKLFEAYTSILWQRAQSRSTLSVIVLYFLLQSKVATYTFEMFNCEEFANGNFLTADYDEQYYTGEHLTRLAVVTLPTLAILVIGVPLVLFKILKKNKNNLHSMGFKLQFGFLYAGFEDQYYYWELWIMTRKTMLNVVATAFAFNSTLQILLFNATCIISMGFHTHAYPYEDPELDIMEQLSQITSLFTVFCGLFISANIVVGPLALLVVVANLLFVAYFLYIARGELIAKVRRMPTRY